MFSSIAPVIGYVQEGKLIGIATTGAKRDPAFPNLPTVAEAGLPGFESSNWYGYMVTARTPRPVVRRLNEAFVAAINHPDVRKVLVAQGNDVIANTPEAFAKSIQADADKWGGIGRKLGIKLD